MTNAKLHTWLEEQVAIGFLRREPLPDGRTNYVSTGRGPILATTVVILHKPDLLEEMAAALQRGHRLLEQAQQEHDTVMAIYRRLSSEAELIADQTWPSQAFNPTIRSH